MLEQFLNVETPPEKRKATRTLYFVPLIFTPAQPKPGLAQIVNWYWEQIQSQLTELEINMGKTNKVYHELIPMGGEEGAKAIGELNKGSYQITRSRLNDGAELYPIESADLLMEFVDWDRCLSAGLQSHTVFDRVSEYYADVQKRRNEYMVHQVDTSLKAGEAGILILREGLVIHFPSDIQVMYISPPDLDELKRWYHERPAQAEHS